MEKPRILVVEDDLHMRGLLKTALEQNGFVLLPASDCERALRIHARTPAALAILDYKLPRGTSGLELARLIKQQDTRLPIIIITAYSTEDLAIEALKDGIDDYFPKPFLIDDLLGSIERLLPSRVLGKCSTSAEPARIIQDLIDGHRMVGESPPMREINAYIRKIAPTDSNVLITGETGTGKELVAELIHKNSNRAMKPFICLNCAAIPDTLLESELFGYERGAFTGAYATQEGKLKQADGGTVFLDEIGDMSLSTQAKMLRVLDKKAIQRLGGRRDVTFDLRIIAATNQNLEELISCGRFRRDLYFRLNVAQIVLPPLRHRKTDIPLLLSQFINQLNRQLHSQIRGVSKELLDYLLHYEWPGNVRELKNVAEVCCLNLNSGMIGLADIPEQYQSKLAGGVTNEKELLLSALFSTKWNKSKAAQKLHWSRMTLYRKMAKYHLVPECKT
ncbi:MAG: sigma-54-dependent transcriptional regulator [Candidatus Methylomirabilis sp.]